jgi:hypothetical protein
MLPEVELTGHSEVCVCVSPALHFQDDKTAVLRKRFIKGPIPGENCELNSVYL